jgi:hypothetical protein
VLWAHHFGSIRREFIRIVSVFRAVFGYEVIHFNFGTTMTMPSLPVAPATSSLWYLVLRGAHSVYSELLQRLELTLLRLFKRHVLITYQGDDARQGDRSKDLFAESIAHHVDSTYYFPQSDSAKRRRIARISRVATSIFFVNPDLQYFLPSSAQFVPYGHIKLTEGTQLEERKQLRPLRLGHAPSHREAKGTAIIQQVVTELQNEGAEIDFVLIENIPHGQMRTALGSVDVLIDQMYAGWYGGISVEAMDLGIPVLSYIRHSDLLSVDEQMSTDLPVVSVTSSTLKEEISRLLTLTETEFRDLRMRSRTYAHKWHNPATVALAYSHYYPVATKQV